MTQVADRVREMKADRRRETKGAGARIKFVEAHAALIEQLSDDYSWHVRGYGPYMGIQASIICETEEEVQAQCRFIRQLLGTRTSEKNVDDNSGKLTYTHYNADKTWRVEVNGGDLTKGCVLIREESWSKPTKYVHFRMECK